MEVTGWSRDNARCRLTAAPSRRERVGRSPNALAGSATRKYSCDALKVRQNVWATQGGRYLAASMAPQLAAVKRHGELTFGQDRYSSQTRAELLAMSSATIDRYLRPIKACDQIKTRSRRNRPLGPRALPRPSIKLGKPPSLRRVNDAVRWSVG